MCSKKFDNKTVKNMKEIKLSKSQCELIYNEFLAKLAERIAGIQKEVSSDKLNDNFLTSDPKEIIQTYLNYPMILRKQNPVYSGNEDEELASAYLLCRFIGSAMNFQMARNVFGEFFNSNWGILQKHLSGSKLSKEEKEIYKNHIWHVFRGLNYKKILKKYETDLSPLDDRHEEAVKHMLNDMKKRAAKNNSAGELTNLDYEEKSIYSRLCRTIIEACQFIESPGGAVAYLWHVEKILEDPDLLDLQKIQKLSKEIKKNVFGFAAALSGDFFREMGIAIFSKPDTHTVHFFEKLFPEIKQLPKKCKIEDIIASIILEIADGASNHEKAITANQVDKVIWLLKSGRFHLHYGKNQKTGKVKKYANLWDDKEVSDFCTILRKKLGSKTTHMKSN